MINGHITICKVYSDGTKEVVLDKSNLVTAGLGSSFLDIQRGAGSRHSSDYTPHYFQVGTDEIIWSGVVRPASSTFYQLSSPLEWSDYGDDTDLIIVQRYRGFNASVSPQVDSGNTYHELLNTTASLSSIIFSGADQYFSQIKEGRTTKYFMDSFESEIVLDENTANGNSISEVGLFAKNPKGFQEDSPLLMAYKSFTAIPKTKDFSIVMHWSIGFLGLNNTVDIYFTGGVSPPGPIRRIKGGGDVGGQGGGSVGGYGGGGGGGTSPGAGGGSSY